MMAFPSMKTNLGLTKKIDKWWIYSFDDFNISKNGNSKETLEITANIRNISNILKKFVIFLRFLYLCLIVLAFSALMWFMFNGFIWLRKRVIQEFDLYFFIIKLKEIIGFLKL